MYFCIFSRDGFCHVGQAGLGLLSLSHPLALASQSAAITGVSLGAQLSNIFSILFSVLHAFSTPFVI